MQKLNTQLATLHEEVQTYFPFIARVAVALYDSTTNEINTFLSSPAEKSPLAQYGVTLSSATWLNGLRHSRRSRVINEMSPSILGSQWHSRQILAADFKASYTVPIFDEARFLGFVFFDSVQSNVFTERVIRQLDLFVRMISLIVEGTLLSVRTLTGGLHLLREISRFRDDETNNHLSRMSHYTQLIARRMVTELSHDDEWVEYMRLFAPLHDIGKIATPDAILFKPGKLTAAEFKVMKQHAVKGHAILSGLVRDLSLETMPHIESLLSIARSHHETWDGHGYPDGLIREQIPIAARIVKVADVFDALTSERCYKLAWPLEKATDYLQQFAGIKFDPQCVAVFRSQIPQITSIMSQFAEQSSDAT